MFYIITGLFGMSHGSYNLNLGSEILILARDIRSRSWPNIGGTYGMPLKEPTQISKVLEVLEQETSPKITGANSVEARK